MDRKEGEAHNMRWRAHCIDRADFRGKGMATISAAPTIEQSVREHGKDLLTE